MTKTEVLKAMLDLLNSPEKWIKGGAAARSDGYPVEVHSSEAVSWCLAGAFALVAGLRPSMMAYPEWVEDFRLFLGRRCYLEYQTSDLPHVNDHRLEDYEDMRMFLKRALLEAEELDAK